MICMRYTATVLIDFRANYNAPFRPYDSCTAQTEIEAEIAIKNFSLIVTISYFTLNKKVSIAVFLTS